MRGAIDEHKQTRRFGDSEPDEFLSAPYFNFNDDKLKFDTNDVDNPNDNYGAASGFVFPSVCD